MKHADELAVHLHESSNEPSQSLIIKDTTLFHLSNGVHVYLLGRKPTQHDREHLPALNVTSPHTWQPDIQLDQAREAQQQFLNLPDSKLSR